MMMVTKNKQQTGLGTSSFLLSNLVLFSGRVIVGFKFGLGLSLVHYFSGTTFVQYNQCSAQSFSTANKQSFLAQVNKLDVD